MWSPFTFSNFDLFNKHRSTLKLAFEKDANGRVVVDQLHEMYEPLHQLVPCKAILFDKLLERNNTTIL